MFRGQYTSNHAISAGPLDAIKCMTHPILWCTGWTTKRKRLKIKYGSVFHPGHGDHISIIKKVNAANS